MSELSHMTHLRLFSNSKTQPDTPLSNPQSKTVEHLLVVTPSTFHRDWQLIDPRITVIGEAVKLAPDDRHTKVAQTIKVPRFAPFTEILSKLANPDNGIQLLKISGNTDDVAAKVTLDTSGGGEAWLKQLPGCEVLRVYEYGWATPEGDVFYGW